MEIKMYKPDLETAPRERLEELQLELLRKQMRYVYERSPAYRRKLEEAGIRPEEIKDLSDLKKVPFTTKDELRRSQERKPLWGEFLCIRPEEGVRVFQTSGTTGIPVRSLLNKNDWFKWYPEQFMYYIYGYGLEPSDILFVPFNYGLYLAWWAFQAACEQFGMLIVPGGGQSSEDRIRNILEFGATVVCGTPTYVVYLAEVAKRMGVDLAGSRVRVVVVAGEPGAQVPETKRIIEESWGAKCYDDVGGCEISNFGFECVCQKGTHIIESMFIPEVIDPDTGKPVEPGQVGELVLSNLCTESMPLIRWRTGDLVKLNYDRCECGRTFCRMEGGILGRADDMFHYAGVNIFPSALENFIRAVDVFSTEYQIVVPKKGSGKRLKIRVEPKEEGIPLEEMNKKIAMFVSEVKYHIGITPEVEVVRIGELPRFEHKAKRIIKEE